MKATASLQRQVPAANVNTATGKATNNPLQLKAKEKNGLTSQKAQNPLAATAPQQNPFQLKGNKTGLPDQLKTGAEALSGYSLDDVKVHYSSAKPAQLEALAYTQGSNIHVAPGQEKHLPHETWHVVQQKQGRVKATMQMKGVAVNDDKGLEREADVMGGRIFQTKPVSLTPRLYIHRRPQNISMQFKRENLAPTTDDIIYINGHHEGLIDDREDRADIPDQEKWDSALTEYNGDIGKGKEKLTSLSRRLSDLASSSNGDGIRPELNEARKNEEDKWENSSLKTSVSPQQKGFLRIFSTNESPGMPPHFDNKFNPKKGEIHAIQNSLGSPENRVTTNDTALWLQYRMAIERQYNKKNIEDQTKFLKKLQSISRVNIVNQHTNRSLYMSRAKGKCTGTKTYKPGSDEFAAILQSPNGVSSYWMLYQQADILNKTFDSIETKDDKYLKIKFKDAPKPKKKSRWSCW